MCRSHNQGSKFLQPYNMASISAFSLFFCFVLFCFALLCFALLCFALFCFVCLFVCLFVFTARRTTKRRPPCELQG